MKWVTREKAKVDRIACPWLIRRFVDPEAEFLFVSKDSVLDVAGKTGATPFDVPGAELYHYMENGVEKVTFDSIIRNYSLSDPALMDLAAIVRGADSRMTQSPAESPGLEAAALGFRETSLDDFDNMRLQFPMYDALYRYCELRLQGKASLEHSGKKR